MKLFGIIRNIVDSILWGKIKKFMFQNIMLMKNLLEFRGRKIHSYIDILFSLCSFVKINEIGIEKLIRTVEDL